MKKFTGSALLIICGFLVRAQQPDSIISKYTLDYQPEKIWLHFDKAVYYSGETIWFKAYVLDGLYPAMKTKTAYIDFIRDDGTILSHTVSPVVEGVTNGQVEIPLDFKGDFIHVRAYTKWMMNFDTAFLFAHDIKVLSTEAAKTKTPAPIVVPDIQFFPEGGDAITGIPNKIAFKATDQWGRPVDPKGVIVDQQGKFVDSLRTQHDGMGYFMLVPQEGKLYSARWKTDRTAIRTTPLPQAKPSGISMQVLTEENKKIIVLHATSGLPPQLHQLHMIGTCPAGMAFKTDITLDASGTARRIISTAELPSGILTVTLFDADWKAIAERISFINNHEFSFQPQMEVLHWGLSHRKRNEVEFTLPDSLSAGSYSVSVTDAAIERDSTENIISGLMLSSEIRGRVFNPAYYFSSDDDSVARHLDLVMLTNGWRRYNWDDVMKGKLPRINFPRDTNYLVFSGQLYGVAKSQLSGKESIVLLTKEKDSSTHMLLLPVNRDGSFADSSMVLFDTLQVWYSLKSKVLSQAEARFLPERMPAPNYREFSKKFMYADPLYDTTGRAHHSRLASKSAELLALDKQGMMENVTIKTKQRTTAQVMDDRYATGMFKGGDGYQFDLVNDQTANAYPNVLTYLQGKVAGLMVSTAGGETSLSWRGGQPQVYVDEVPTDLDVATNIPVSDIAYVKVFRPPFMGGFGGANGAIVLYTRKGNDTQNASTGLSTNKIVAYTPIKQFYSPNYDNFDPRNDRLDIRTTVYWNPLLRTTAKDHKIRITFYNNDVANSFRVVLEGMTGEGILTHFEQVME